MSNIVFNQSSPELNDGFGFALIAGNFNGIGATDLVVGVPQEDIPILLSGSIANAGAINVYTGTNAGLDTNSPQTFHQNIGMVQDVAESNDGFGSRLAVGDFDGDGRDDLAVGIMGEDVGGIYGAGAVQIFHGTANGLTDSPTPFFHQNALGMPNAAETSDNFGSSLVAADFNGDGRDDLAVGVSGEDIWVGSANYSNAGAVNIMYGSNSGLSTLGGQFYHQNSLGIQDSVETNDYFGRAVTAADYNGDGYADLAVSSYESVGSVNSAGAVNVIYGSANGLTYANNQLWSQDTSGVKDSAEFNDQFGSSLASGDFDGNGRDDLAIGILNEEIDGIANAGAVSVIYGTVNGLQEQSDDFFHQGVNGIEGTPEAGDHFGSSLGVGDFNGDGYDDLAIGVRDEAVNGADKAGAVNILYGSSTGLTTVGNQLIHQDSPGMLGLAEAYDQFGYSLSVGDFNNDGYADLGIGAPGDSVGATAGAGVVNIVFGSANGLVV